jgi:hypothetical protein
VQNDVVNAKDPTAHVAVIVNGIDGRTIGGTPYVTQMPNFGWLNDGDIAAIINFEGKSWGNHGPIVSAQTVAVARRGASKTARLSRRFRTDLADTSTHSR